MNTERLSPEELMEEVQSADTTTLDFIRDLCKNNLFFLVKAVLGMRDVNKKTHAAFCAFFQDTSNLRRMALMPRGHLKSSIGTVGDTVRILLESNGEARVMIANEVNGNAVGFLTEIKSHFETNELLRFLFGHLVPDRFNGPGVLWSSQGIRLLRKGNFKEPSVYPVGVGDAVTSKHFTHMKLDDLIGLEAKRSEAEMRKAINWNNNIESLIIRADLTIIDWIGTRWLRNDLYGHVMKQYGKRLKVFRRGMFDKESQLIFPTFFNMEMVEQLMKTPDVWHAQYLNDPQAEGVLDFYESDLRSFVFDNSGAVVYSEGGITSKWSRNSLDIVLTVDPNSGKKTAPDEAAVGITGMSPKGQMFSLEDWGGRPSPTGLIDKIFEMACRWNPRVVGIEDAGQQNTIHYFEEKCRDAGRWFNIVPLKHKNVEKEVRIRTSLQPIISAGKFYIPVGQTALRSQIVNFPDLANDDRIDRLSYAAEIHRIPMSLEQSEKAGSLVKKMLQARKRSRTGY